MITNFSLKLMLFNQYSRINSINSNKFGLQNRDQQSF